MCAQFDNKRKASPDPDILPLIAEARKAAGLMQVCGGEAGEGGLCSGEGGLCVHGCGVAAVHPALARAMRVCTACEAVANNTHMASHAMPCATHAVCGIKVRWWCGTMVR